MSPARLIVFILSLIAVGLLSGAVAAEFSPAFILKVIGVLTLFIVAFLNTEIGLYILIFSMLLSPEFVAGDVAGGAALGRGLTLRLDDFLLAIIGFGWFAKNAVYKELGLFLRTPLNKPIFFYIVTCLISTGFGIIVGRVNPNTGFFFVLKYFEYMIVFFMVVNYLENTTQVKRFLFCMFLTCAITSVVGSMQIPEGGRVSAPFEGEQGEPNTFGGYLVFISALAIALVPAVKSIRQKTALVALLAVMIPPFLFTRSRSSYLAALPAMLTLGLMSKKRMIVLCLMAVALIISPLFLPQQVKERILFTIEQKKAVGERVEIAGVKLDTSTSARIVSWVGALDDWTQKPILGYGVTGYAFVDAQFPRVLAETGIFGLIAFLYLLFSIFNLATTNYKQLKDPFNRALVRGFIAGYIGLIFHAIGANTFIIVRIMEPFWFLVGIVAVLPKLEEAAELEPAEAEVEVVAVKRRILI